MKNIFNIVKKELDKIFKNPRLIISTFLLPGLLIFLLYSFMGSSAENQVTKTFNHEYKIIMINESTEMEKLINELEMGLKISIGEENSDFKITIIDNTYGSNIDEIYSKIEDTLKNEEIDLWIDTPSDFDKIITGVVKGSVDVKIYTHSNNIYSQTIKEELNNLINYKVESLNIKEYNVIPNIIDTATLEEINSSYIATLAPMLIMTFIFAGALSIGADSIAGEKERGTIATMLMAPISKNEIVLGKIISAIIITIISAICSFIGLMASLTSFTQAVGATSDIAFEISFGTGIKLLIMILLISLIAVSLFLVASTFAKSTKEATMYAMPVYIIGIISGVFTMFDVSMPSEIIPYIIPIYNLTLGLKGILMDNLMLPYFLTIIGSNIVYFIIILFVVRKMFNSERIMFSR